MMRGLFTAASGMEAQQLMVDTISNNLANVNTVGFKKKRINFQDLFYQTLQQPGTLSTSEFEVPTGLQIGHGTRPVSIQPIFTTGIPVETGNHLDLMIEGEGFFKISLPDGSTGYTRDGSFQLNSTGQMVNSDGFLLDPTITIDSDTVQMNVGRDGTVSLVTGDGTSTTAGQVDLVSFVNPAGLEQRGGNLFLETDASGAPLSGTPGESGLGVIRQRFLEMSNVQIVEELINLIIAQRAYEVNSKTIQTADDMLQEANSLRR